VSLYRSQSRTDVTLIVQSREFKVHRIILSTRSKYFKELFEAYPSQSKIVLEENFDSDAFEMILEYIYGGQIVVSTRKANILEPIAKKFQLKKVNRDKLNLMIRIFF
jgi:hypothetical protein